MLTHVLSNGHFFIEILAAIDDGEWRQDGREEGSLDNRTTDLLVVPVTEERVTTRETLQELVCKRLIID